MAPFWIYFFRLYRQIWTRKKNQKTLMKATLRPPSIRILVFQFQSRGLWSGGRIFPSNWKTPLEPGPSSWMEESPVRSVSLDTKVKMKRRLVKCPIERILEPSVVSSKCLEMIYLIKKTFKSIFQFNFAQSVIANLVIFDVMISNKFTEFYEYLGLALRWLYLHYTPVEEWHFVIRHFVTSLEFYKSKQNKYLSNKKVIWRK